MGNYLIFFYIFTVFFSFNILAETENLDPATLAQLQQGLNSKCSDFSGDESSYNKDNIKCTAIEEISNSIFGEDFLPTCNNLESCPICVTPSLDQWNESKKQINNLVQHGKKACQCCETPEQCFANDEGFVSLMGNLRTTGNLLSATATGASMASGHRTMCEVLAGLQGGLAAVNGAAGTNCISKGETCSTNYGNCLSQLSTLEEKIQKIVPMIESIETKISNRDTGSGEYLSNLKQQLNEFKSLPINLDQEIRLLKKKIREEEEKLKNTTEFSETCTSTKAKYEEILSEIGSLREKLDKNKGICQYINESGQKLVGSGTAYGVAAAVAHECSENKDSKQNQNTKHCLINPVFPECCQHPLIYSSYQKQCKGETPPCELTAQNPAEECRGFCDNNPDDERCKKETDPGICLTNPDHESCQTGDDEDEEDESTTLGSETGENNDSPVGADNSDDEDLFPPLPDMLPIPKNNSSGKPSGPRNYAGNTGSGGSGLGGGLGGPGPDGGEGEDEDEDGEGEEDPYKNLLQGLSAGKQNSGDLTGGGSPFDKESSGKDGNKSKLNLKKFLPKNIGRIPSSLLGMSKNKTIFDIHSEVMKGYCDKYQLQCIKNQK